MTRHYEIQWFVMAVRSTAYEHIEPEAPAFRSSAVERSNEIHAARGLRLYPILKVRGCLQPSSA